MPTLGCDRGGATHNSPTDISQEGRWVSLQSRRSRGACWVMWHVRCLWEVMCSIGPGSSFNIHCNFGVCRLLSAWDSTGHALRFCSELPVEETLKGAGFEVCQKEWKRFSHGGPVGGVGMETEGVGQSILSTATARVPPRSDPPISFRRVDGTVREGNMWLSLGAWQSTKE